MSDNLDAQLKPSSPHQDKKSHTLLKALAVIIPIVVSLAALAVSIFAYSDQHQTDQSAAVSARQAYADQVSFWLTSPSKGVLTNEQLIVQNRNPVPISNVWVSVSIVTPPYFNNPKDYSGMIGFIPPCSVDSTNTLYIVELSAVLLTHLGQKRFDAEPQIRDMTATVNGMEFTDASGLTWWRASDGTVKQEPTVNRGTLSPTVPYDPGKLSQSNGCA